MKLAAKSDLIHTVTYFGTFPTKFASLLTRKPAIVNIYEVLGNRWKTVVKLSGLNYFFVRVLEKITLKIPFDKVITVSNSTVRNLVASGVKKKKIGMIYPGVDYDLFNPRKAKGATIRRKLGIRRNEFIYMFFG